jgi:hypothetical protein
VFSDDFLNGVVAVQQSCHAKLEEQKREGDLHVQIVAGWTYAKSFLLVSPDASERLIPPGPYFMVGGGLHQAWRIYPDKLNAFMTTVVPNITDSAKYAFRTISYTCRC